MQWATTWVFLSFSCIFGCSLTFFSVHLDASHWNLEFFGFTQTTFFVHPKNSRFQCSASRFTEKTVSSQPKMQEKLKKTSGCSLHSFLQHRKYFADGKWLEKNNFSPYGIEILFILWIWKENWQKPLKQPTYQHPERSFGTPITIQLWGGMKAVSYEFTFALWKKAKWKC